MKLIKTKEEYLEENYLELHYDEIDDETVGVLERLRSALKYIEGTHDFKSFTAGDDVRDDYVRTIIQTNLIRDLKNVNMLDMESSANAELFLLYNFLKKYCKIVI